MKTAVANLKSYRAHTGSDARGWSIEGKQPVLFNLELRGFSKS